MPHLLPVPFSSPKTLQSGFDGWYVFSDIESILLLNSQMITQLEKTCARSFICCTEAGSHTLKPAECQRPWDLEIITNDWPWLSSTCFAWIGKHQANLLGAQVWVVTTFLCGNETVQRFCFLPLWFSSNLTFLLPAPSAFHIPSTSGPGLCDPCSANSSSWKSCGSRTATRVFSWRCV